MSIPFFSSKKFGFNPAFALGFEKNGLNPRQYKTCEQKNHSRIRCNTTRMLLRAKRSSGEDLETFCQNSNAKAGLTLVELLIAVGLIGMIVLAIMSVDVASRRFFNTSDFETRVQNEVSPILELMAKDVLRAIGQKGDSGVLSPSSNRIEIRQDTARTYSDYSDDPWVAYFFGSNAISTESRANTASSWTGQEQLARNIVGCQFVISADTAVQITITARRDASQPASSANPEVRLESSSFPRLQSIN